MVADVVINFVARIVSMLDVNYDVNDIHTDVVCVLINNGSTDWDDIWGVHTWAHKTMYQMSYI